jgi:hypothetical protein
MARIDTPRWAQQVRSTRRDEARVRTGRRRLGHRRVARPCPASERMGPPVRGRGERGSPVVCPSYAHAPRSPYRVARSASQRTPPSLALEGVWDGAHPNCLHWERPQRPLYVCRAALGIAVVREEGAAVEALQAANVVCPNTLSALRLLTEPKRLIATLRPYGIRPPAVSAQQDGVNPRQTRTHRSK